MRAMAFLLAALGIVSLASADEIVFTNGDHLTGKIEKLEGGKLTIQSSVAGTVTADLKDIRTFSTDAPIEVHLKDGTVIHQKIAAGADGQFAVEQGGAIQPQAFAVGEIKAINPPKAKWTGSVSAGALLTRGNSYSDNFTLSLDAIRRTDDDRITASAGYFYGKQQDKTTGNKSTSTDNWFAAGKYDYFFTPKFYGYGNARLERDRIADLDLRFIPGAGVGYQWIESPKQNFSTEAGLSWVYESFTNPDRTDDFLAARLAYHYDLKINDKVKVFHDLEVFPSLEDVSQFLVNAQAGLRATLTKQFFTEFKIVYLYNSDPAPTASRNDLRYVLGVGWTF